MSDSSHTSVVSRLARYDRVVEVGVGNRPDVAAALAARGVTVVVTDVSEREVPAGVRFVRDDVTDPDRTVYADADAIFARNLPPELHRPTWELAREVGADFLFTTLGTEQPAPGVPVSRERLPTDTLFVAGDRSEPV